MVEGPGALLWGLSVWGVMVKENTEMGRRFNPERYGMIYCPVCKGRGKLFNAVGEGAVCKMCGGFGFIKKEEENKRTFNVDAPTRKL